MITRNKQNGFTLLEVLIAMLVLSIGLLGIAGLQAASLQYGLDASNRAQVTILAEDILSKMRMQTSAVDSDNIPGIITQYTAAGGGACNPTVVGIQAELNCWNSDIAAILPSGVGTITAAAGVGARGVNITITWFEQGAKSYTTEASEAAGAAGAPLREGTRFFNLTAVL